MVVVSASSNAVSSAPPRITQIHELLLAVGRHGHSFTSEQQNALEEYLLSLTGGATHVPPDKTAVPGTLPSSVAGRCLGDWPRSWMFARAVVNSIDRLLERAPGRDIFAVDAGCGPYAFLALVAALRSPQVKVLALEGNPRSVALASNVAESLGLADRVLILEEDARTFEAACPIDLLMTETFDAGLVEEHGSSILKNLRSQVALSGISIPSHVQVDAELINIEIHPGRFALRVALREPAFSSGVEETLEAEFSASDLERGIYQLVLKTSYDLAPDVPQITTGSQCAISVPQQVAVFEILNPVERLRLCLRPGKISISIESTPSENIKVLSDLSCYRPRRRE